MARPRKYVQDANGRTVDGLSFHGASGRYYSIGDDGQRRYYGSDKDRAIAEYHRDTLVWFRPDYDDDDSIRPEPAMILIKWGEAPDTKLKRRGSKERLSDCLEFWTDWMTGDGEKATTEHVLSTCRFFNRFIQCVGNLPVSLVKKASFVEWQKTIRAKANKWSAKTSDDHHRAVARVLKLAKRKNDGWRFPDGLIEWADDWKYDKRTPYVPKQQNKEPMPVDVFNGLLKVADEWAATNPDTIDATTQSGRAKRRQAQIKKRQGVQFSAMLGLGIHGLANIDCARIAWSDLHLDDDLPHLSLPRTKCEHKTGYAVDRKTPLLPSCVDALKRWRKYERRPSTVFRTSQGNPFDSNTIADVIKKLREENGSNGWSFKHLRNVGGTVADKAGLSEMKIDRFLGHTLKRERSKYLGSVGPDYLTDLVNLIGAEYFAGENV